MQKDSILIIGAGASGLMAAYLLAEKMQVTLLEAQDRIGGRIHSVTVEGAIRESGAEFIHGDLPVTFALLKQVGIPTKKVEGKVYRHRDEKLVEEEDMVKGWDVLLKKMKSVEHDMTLERFLTEYFPEPENKLLRKEATSYAEGFDLADSAKASIKALYLEWSHEDDNNYRIPSGYSTLIHYLETQITAKGGTIKTSTIAKKINWQKNEVAVTDAAGNEFSAQKILITIPLPVLAAPDQKSSVEFIPAVHALQQAAGKIGFGAVVKIILVFKKAFWKPDTGFILSNETFKTWWTQLPDVSPTLTGWVGGPCARDLFGNSDDELVAKALSSLALLFKIPADELQENLQSSLVCNGGKNEFSPSGYSYSMVGSAAAKELLRSPLEETLFFAGEGLYEGESPGTVEAALVTGKHTAENILKNLSNS